MSKIHEYIGVDLGMSKSGVARGNNAARLAEPVGTVKTSDLLESLKAMSEKNDAQGIVVGLPRSLNGQDTQQTKWTREWAAQAKTQLGLPLYWQDEALSSVHAAKDKSGNDDAAAAAIILQDFLNTPDNERVVC